MVKNSRAFLVALALVLTTSAAADPTTITLTGRAMGTTWAVKFLQPLPPAAPLDLSSLTARITTTLEHLESLFSTYRPTSELSRFNASPSTDWQPVSPELARVAHDSRRLSELTAGAFDVTVEPLLRLWGFGPQRRITHTLPSADELAAARARVDYRRLEIRVSPPALRKTSPDLSADFSSMAKGFAADALSDLLTSLHAPNHLTQVGGDIKTSGHSSVADLAPWRTGIENPAAASSLAHIVPLSGHALSTSGDAHNFLTLAGRRYGHIVDPRTGRPAATSLASISVIHASCATSSALATALFVLGPEAGFALATREHLACLFILRDGAAFLQHATPEFERLVAPTSP